MARSFNGSTDQIETAASYAFPAAVSFACWLNPGTLSNAYNGIMSRANNAATSFVQILLKSTGHPAFYVQGTGGTNSFDPATATVTSGVWNHIALTYSSAGNFATYVNGSNSNNTSSLGAVNSGTAPMDIGYDHVNAGRNFPGLIADAAEWNVQLTPAEIAALANGARPYTIRPLNLNGYWPLDGLQSPEPDLSGNAVNGTLTGTTNGFGPPLLQFTPRWPMPTPSVTPTPSFLGFAGAPEIVRPTVII